MAKCIRLSPPIPAHTSNLYGCLISRQHHRRSCVFRDGQSDDFFDDNNVCVVSNYFAFLFIYLKRPKPNRERLARAHRITRLPHTGTPPPTLSRLPRNERKRRAFSVRRWRACRPTYAGGEPVSAPDRLLVFFAAVSAAPERFTAIGGGIRKCSAAPM